jgi:hypothetical protein
MARGPVGNERDRQAARDVAWSDDNRLQRGVSRPAGRPLRA